MPTKGRTTVKSRVNQRKVRSTRIANRNESLSFGYLILTIACATVMAAGFFLVAVQHFVSIELGFKNSTMRKQITDLEAEKRRLLLAKEVALSPVEVTRTASKLGFREAEAIIVAAAADIENQTANGMKSETPKATDDKKAPAVTAIVSSKPVAASPKQSKSEVLSERPVEKLAAGLESRPRRVTAERENTSRALTTIAKLR